MEPLTENEQIVFETQKECHICERSFDALPPMLEKEILITKMAIQYYKYLGCTRKGQICFNNNSVRVSINFYLLYTVNPL